MFQSIELLNHEVSADGKFRATFAVNDTCFRQQTELSAPQGVNSPSSLEPVAILAEYSKRKLHVARNLAIYYLGLQDGDQYLGGCDLAFIEKNYPAFNYANKYVKLVKLYHDDFKRILKVYEQEEELQKLFEKIEKSAPNMKAFTNPEI